MTNYDLLYNKKFEPHTVHNITRYESSYDTIYNIVTNYSGHFVCHAVTIGDSENTIQGP